MKIIAVGRNYAEHARELGNEVPAEPVLFLKPSTALVLNDQPFTYPSFSTDIHFEVELVLRVSQVGKEIPMESASEYYDAITVGIDFTARDVQAKLKAKGLPWEISKAFDQSAPLGRWVNLPTGRPIHFSLTQNGETKQQGTTDEMLNGFDAIIHYVSKYFTLEVGDLIFTGTPAGVGPVQKGDLLEAYLEGERLLACNVN